MARVEANNMRVAFQLHSNSSRLVSKNGTPILPTKRNYKDPTMQAFRIKAASRDVNKRLAGVEGKIEAMVASIPVVAVNADERRYDYTLTPQIMQSIYQTIETMLLQVYTGGAQSFSESFWLYPYIRSAYISGAELATDSARNVSAKYASASAVAQLDTMISSDPFTAGRLARASIVGSRAFEEMKGLVGTAKADLAATLFNGIDAGLGVRDIVGMMMERVGVSGRRATKIARTEINNAYRVATRRETDVINEEVFGDEDYELMMLWFSALTSTTRKSHARRHGRTYTTAQVDQFYAVDANAINCYCTQTAVLVNKKTGEVLQGDLVDKMQEQKKEYFADLDEAA